MDLDVGPEAPTAADGAVVAAPGRRPRRARAALALLLAAGAGAGGTLLAVRAHDASDVRLVVLSTSPDLDAPADADGVSVDVLVAGLGAQDVTVLGGGTGAPGRGTTGQVVPADAAWLPRERAQEPVVVPAGGTAGLLLRLVTSCDDPPPWRPWLRVRAGGGGEQVVALETVDRSGVPTGAVLQAVCEYREETDLSPVTVVGRRSAPDGTVALELGSTARVPYRVSVLDGGVSGLSLAGGDVEVPPGSSTQVTLVVEPPRCVGALRADDVLGGALVQAGPVDGDDRDGPDAVPVDLWVAEAQVALAVGRVCADA